MVFQCLIIYKLQCVAQETYCFCFRLSNHCYISQYYAQDNFCHRENKFIMLKVQDQDSVFCAGPVICESAFQLCVERTHVIKMRGLGPLYNLTSHFLFEAMRVMCFRVFSLLFLQFSNWIFGMVCFFGFYFINKVVVTQKLYNSSLHVLINLTLLSWI